MLWNTKKAVLLSVLSLVTSISLAMPVNAEEEVMNSTLDELVVEGTADPVIAGGFAKENVSVGIIGSQGIMTAPMTITELSNKTLTTFASPHTGIADALSLDPSVRADRGGTYTDISIRGIYQSGHAFYVNGIPGLLCQENIPYYWADSVSVISGPNLGVNATAYSEAAAGSVNLKSKVASAEGNGEVKITYRGGSSMQEAVDFGGRFGENDQYGVRITASNIHGDTAIDGENLKQQSFSLNLDQKSEKSTTNLLVIYDHTDHSGGPGAISFGSGVTSLPSAPSNNNIYKPEWAYNEYDNWIIALNHEQKVADHLSYYLNAGYHREDWYGYIDGNPTVINNQGDFTISMTNYPLALTKKYVGTGLKGDFKIGEVKNEYLIGFDRTWYNYDLSKNPNFADSGTWSGTGNLYINNHWATLGREGYKAEHSQDATMNGWHIVDNIKALDDRLLVTLGLHGHEVKRTPVDSSKQESDAICPTFAVSYKTSPVVTVFADHSESFGIGSMVSTTSGYANGGEILDPAKTKQNEIGVKIKTGVFLNTISLFRITQANSVDVYDSKGNKYLVLDGEQTNKGIEWSFTGTVAKKLDLIGGVMYLDASDDDGSTVNGASKWSGTLGAIYNITDDFSVIGRATYLGSASINNGALHVPAYTKFDLGASYKTKINTVPVKLDLMCYNLTDKNYWSARSGSNSLLLGAPRTIVFSATFDI